MSNTCLQQPFIRLWRHYQGKKSETTLQSLAEILHYPRQRRMREGKMNTFGWFDFKSAWFRLSEG
uniref:SgrR family transcriptional regulator n=1 Tax=Xenorhabdus sp. Sc-CR9 TaxID=2584468 RepID=UPI001F2F8711|nr:SgrR family transcriptional regulator [Xenorhabdus sp. Sc-CR9]